MASVVKERRSDEFNSWRERKCMDRQHVSLLDRRIYEHSIESGGSNIE